MHAWQFTNTHEPLVMNDVPEPTAAPGGVVIEVKAAGLCHSDVGLLEDEGWLALLAKRPITIGHEVAGVVAEVGEGVTDWKVGDRVGVCPTTDAGAPGYAFDGGFAPKMAVDRIALVRIPENVSFAYGAAGTDAGMTSHHAVIATGGVKAGTKLGVIGFGGLGQIGARVAVLAGAEVYVAEVNESVWDNVRAAGVKGVAKSIRDFADVGLDVIVDFAGFGVTTADAIETVRPGGRVVQVGMGRLEATINTRDLITKAVTLAGSVGGTKDDVQGVYDYFATGELNPAITEISFDEIPDGIQRLADGKVVGRLVATSGF
ncbi:zinc-binding dehydrogenase [Agromyces archimandritae]|uniref:Zinc-binding dehydrogenase n=1 Tax=Agromyces archimandritae TaxID=2781962 RepID=A0A975FJW2_9MICO|nr:zinc-binding dehydrogenase [Agromyces archimandritae]QTX03370.1 zinc-binding dehydrogenase [Agromyces archimandritae]